MIIVTVLPIATFMMSWGREILRQMVPQATDIGAQAKALGSQHRFIQNMEAA
jgi:hypothetical protein